MGRVTGGQPGIDWNTRRRAASEGSLYLTVQKALTLSGSGQAAKEGERMSARVRAVGEGMAVLLERNQEGSSTRDFEGGGGLGLELCGRYKE